MTDLNFRFSKKITNTVIAKKNENSPVDIPDYPNVAKFLIVPGDKLSVFVESKEFKDYIPWEFILEESAPQSVNVTIGGD